MELSYKLNLQYCENCKLHYFPDIENNSIPDKCNICGGNLIDTKISYEEYKKLPKTKRCPKCKRKYPKLFIKCSKCNVQLIKLSTENKRLDKQVEEIRKQTQESRSSQQTNIPKCPICQSTNLSKITNTRKAGKIALFGIFGAGDLGKTWKCNNCGSKF